MMKYLKLIRFQNLLMIALMQCIIRYGFLKLQKVELALADWQFALLVLATVFIAAMPAPVCHAAVPWPQQAARRVAQGRSAGRRATALPAAAGGTAAPFHPDARPGP